MVGVIALLKVVLSPKYPNLAEIVGGVLAVGPTVYLVEPALDAIGIQAVQGRPFPRKLVGALLLSLSLLLAILVLSPMINVLAELIAATIANN